MKKFLMAAVALFCMTMTCVTLTSCGDDNDSKVADKEYTVTSAIDWTNEGSLSEAEVIAIDVLGKSINATNLFVDDADARRALDEVANRVASNIRGNGWINFQHVRAKNSFVTMTQIQRVVFHKGRLFIVGQNLQQPIHSGRLPVTFCPEAIAIPHQHLRSQTWQLL